MRVYPPKNKKPSRFYKTELFFTRVFFAVLAALTILMIIAVLTPHSNESFNTGKYHALDKNLKVTFDDGTVKYVNPPVDLKVSRENSLTVESSLPDDITDEDQLYIYSDEQDIKVYIDGKYRGGYKGNHYNNDMILPSAWFDLELNHFDSGKSLSIFISENSSHYTKGCIRPIYVGNQTAILYHFFRKQSIWGLAGFFIFVFGLVLTISFFVYRKDTYIKRYIYLGVCLVFMGAWIFFSNSGRQLYLNEIGISQYVGILCANLSIYPFILFMAQGRNKKAMVFFKILAGISIASLGIFAGLLMKKGITPQTIIRQDKIWFLILAIILIYDISEKMLLKRSDADTPDFITSRGYVWKVGIVSILLGGTLDFVIILINKATEHRVALTIGTMIFAVCCFITFLQEIKRIHVENMNLYAANEEKSRFLAKMSHAIRTPVNSVLGMNNLILRENKDPIIREYATDIERAGNTLISTIDDILDASAVNSNEMKLNPVKYQISSLINDCRSIMYLRANEKHLKFIINMNPQIPAGLIGDEYRLREIILNLLSNAIKYTKKGSIFFITDFKPLDDKHINLILAVRDTGMGIHSSSIKSLFSDYSRLNLMQTKNIEGTGLGLAITKSLIEKMGGTIEVNSVYGTGSEFIVTIPQEIYDSSNSGSIKEVTEDTKKSTRDSRWFSASKVSVLIVDDVLMNRKVIMKLMAPSNMDITTVESGRKAIESTSKKKYDIIFLDHMMPEMDGIETLKVLRHKNCADTPIIMLTANAVPGIREMYLETGFDDYLAKPVTEAALIEVCLKHLPQELIEKMPEDTP